MVKEQVTSIQPDTKNMNAVFLLENGELQRQEIILAGHVRLDDDGSSQTSVQAMVWDSSRKAFFRANSYDSFLGLELATAPGDWHQHIAERRRQNEELYRGADEAMSAIEQDMKRNGDLADERREQERFIREHNELRASITPPPVVESVRPLPRERSSPEQVDNRNRRSLFSW